MGFVADQWSALFNGEFRRGQALGFEGISWQLLGKNLKFLLQPVDHFIAATNSPLHFLHAAFHDLE